jgi:hypothetical protein
LRLRVDIIVGSFFHGAASAVKEIANYDGDIHQVRRWAQDLLGCLFSIVHRPARMMRDVDYLFRLYDEVQSPLRGLVRDRYSWCLKTAFTLLLLACKLRFCRPKLPLRQEKVVRIPTGFNRRFLLPGRLAKCVGQIARLDQGSFTDSVVTSLASQHYSKQIGCNAV